MNPFDYINSINFQKNNMMRDTENDQLAEKQYPAFMVNRGLSMFADTLMYANEMNTNHHIDNKLQYEYLINIVRPKKRFSKWVKKIANDDVEAVKQYFDYNDEKAIAATSLLSEDQIKIIKDKLSKGGNNGSGKDG